MAELQITESDVAEQENWLATYLTSRFPTLDFSEGSILRTGLLRMMVYPFTILKAIIKQQILPRQSLLNLNDILSTEETDIIVDQYLANWFLSRKDGTYAQGVARIHLNQQTDITIPNTTLFQKDNQTFVTTQNNDLSIAADSLQPVTNTSGAIIEYTIEIQLTANLQGAAGEIDAGSFDAWEQFNPYTIGIEAVAKFYGGRDVESTTDLIERASTAITERSLVTQRGIDSTLRDTFTQVPLTVTIGANEPEMMRDFKTLSSGDTIHVLNHVNIYIPFPVLPSQTIELEIGAAYKDPGDPESIPFAWTHTIVLPAIPYLRMIKIEDLNDGTIFTRVNNTPTIDGEYQIVEERIYDSFSSQQYRKIVLYDDGLGSRDGHIMKITYDTANGFTNVDTFVLSVSKRILVANTLVFSQYPIWLTCTIDFTYLDSAQETLDIESAEQYIAEFINNFPSSETLSVSAIITNLKNSFINIISSIEPFTIYYNLECPDGRVIPFETTSEVAMDTSNLVNPGDITDFYALQLSDRTVRYLTAPDLITIEEKVTGSGGGGGAAP